MRVYILYGTWRKRGRCGFRITGSGSFEPAEGFGVDGRYPAGNESGAVIGVFGTGRRDVTFGDNEAQICGRESTAALSGSIGFQAGNWGQEARVGFIIDYVGRIFEKAGKRGAGGSGSGAGVFDIGGGGSVDDGFARGPS